MNHNHVDIPLIHKYMVPAQIIENCNCVIGYSYCTKHEELIADLTSYNAMWNYKSKTICALSAYSMYHTDLHKVTHAKRDIPRVAKFL